MFEFFLNNEESTLWKVDMAEVFSETHNIDFVESMKWMAMG